ncbi:Esterase/lipase/thioesterase [Pseudohyphozyma bogoriensis]|nr:Esterase/lipase/thioesterase [Pseudohyphozyma bogoriensis]
MQRDLLKSKLPQLPALSPEGDELEELEEEELDSFPASLARAAPPPRRTIQKGKDYLPISASSYFSEALEVNLAAPSTAVFRVYYTPAIPSKAPIESIPSISDSLGAGPAKAPWLKPTSAEDEGKGVLDACVHGAGYSALSFACLAKALKEKSSGMAGVLSYDQRGHGESVPIRLGVWRGVTWGDGVAD